VHSVIVRYTGALFTTLGKLGTVRTEVSEEENDSTCIYCNLHVEHSISPFFFVRCFRRTFPDIILRIWQGWPNSQSINQSRNDIVRQRIPHKKQQQPESIACRWWTVFRETQLDGSSRQNGQLAD